MAAKKFDCYMVKIGIGSHPKLARLTDSEFRAHIAGVLAIAAMSPIRGRMLVGELDAEPADIARIAGVSARIALTAVNKLIAIGVLERDEELGCLRVHDWDDINPAPAADPGAAERQRKRREKLRVTAMSRAKCHAVTDDVTGTEVEVEVKEAKASSSDASRSDPEEAKASDDDKHLCRLLADLAKAHNPKFKVKSRSKWLQQMRLLRERDGNTPADVEALIRWLFTDKGPAAQFWADVIQSPANLREHFAVLWAKKTGASSAAAAKPVEDSAAFLARRGAA